jgi:LDH2 family malate/lactate/ureidoglycolate dehydrogenase
VSAGDTAAGKTAITASLDDARDFIVRVLRRLDVPDDGASVVAECLLYSEIRGHESHGIVRLPVYGKRVHAGVVNARPHMRVAVDGVAAAVVDGDNGLGPVVGWFAMGKAIELAKRYGIGLAIARNSNHYGASGFYTERAAENGCAGFSASNAPPNMAPWGGRERFLGTNPFSIAVPQNEPWPLNADMATSVVARGNIILAAEKGESIPSGWAIDPEGNPTCDAKAALKGSVLPFAGPKGAAISLLIDILSGVLSGSSYGRHLNTLENLHAVQRLGQVFIAIDIVRLMPLEDFKTRVGDLLTQMKATPRGAGVGEILAPGEPEARRAGAAKTTGISIPAPVGMDLIAIARLVGASVPEFLLHLER